MICDDALDFGNPEIDGVNPLAISKLLITRLPYRMLDKYVLERAFPHNLQLVTRAVEDVDELVLFFDSQGEGADDCVLALHGSDLLVTTGWSFFDSNFERKHSLPELRIQDLGVSGDLD